MERTRLLYRYTDEKKNEKKGTRTRATKIGYLSPLSQLPRTYTRKHTRTTAVLYPHTIGNGKGEKEKKKGDLDRQYAHIHTSVINHNASHLRKSSLPLTSPHLLGSNP